MHRTAGKLGVCSVIDSNFSDFSIVLGGVFKIDFIEKRNRLFNIKV